MSWRRFDADVIGAPFGSAEALQLDTGRRRVAGYVDRQSAPRIDNRAATADAEPMFETPVPPFEASAGQPVEATRTVAPAPVGWARVRRNVAGWVALPHTGPVVVVLLTTAGMAFLAVDGAPRGDVLVRLLLAMLGGQLAIGAVNELVDADLDARTKPGKPIPAGIVSPRAARVLTAVSLAAMVGFSASFGPASLVLCSLGTGAGLAYDLVFKRTLFSWLPYLVALPMLPLWVWTAVRGFEPRLLMLYPLGALAVVGVHLAQALPDTASDRQAGIRSLSSLLGFRRTRLVCWAATLSAPLLAAPLAPVLTGRPAPVWWASGLVVGLVGLNAAAFRAGRRLGLATCFPCTAISTAAMGLGWVLAIR